MNEVTMLAINDIYEGEATPPTRIVAIGVRIAGQLWHPSAAPMAAPQDCRYCAFVFSLVAGKQAPVEVDWQELLEDLDSGAISKSVPSVVVANKQSLSASKLESAQSRWKVIEGLIEDPRMRIFQKHGRKGLIDAHASTTGAAPNTILRALRDVWRGGSRDALVPGVFVELEKAKRQAQSQSSAGVLPLGHDDSCRCSHTHLQRLSRGRKTDELNSLYKEPYLLVGEERKRVIARAKELYDPKQKTLKKVYRDIIIEFYSYIDESGVLRPKRPGSRPSSRQLSYTLLRALKLSTKLLLKSSDAEFQNDHKGKTGTAKDVAPCVGHTYQIDSTIVDVLLRSRHSRRKVIGKATLYLIVDTVSRLVVGFHLTLEKPSLENAIEAILSIAEDKADLCRRWGAKYRPEAWIATGLYPTKFITDRGSDFTAGEFIQLVEGLGIGLYQAPARLSSRKGMVELMFRLVNVNLRGDTPGWVDPIESAKRQADDPRPASRHTLQKLGGEIIDGLTAHNLKIQIDYERNVEEVEENEPASPVGIFQRDYERSAGHMRLVPYQAIRWTLQRFDMAVVTQNGFYINRCFYGEANGQFSEWFVRAGRGRFKIFCFFDSRLVDSVWIRDSKNVVATPIEVSLNSHSIRFKGMSVQEVIDVKKQETSQAHLAHEHNLELDIELKLLSEKRKAASDAEYALAVAAAGDDKSNVDIDGELRAREIAEGRAEGVARRDSTATHVPAPSQVQSSATPAPAPATKAKQKATLLSVEDLDADDFERDLLDM